MGYYRNDSPISLGQARVIAIGKSVIYFDTVLYGTLCVPHSVICYRDVMKITQSWEELFVKTWFVEIINPKLLEKYTSKKETRQ